MSEQEKLVEAVAKAMCEALYGDTHRAGWERYRKLARAAIAVTVEACAQVAGPRFPRPCDCTERYYCTECYCGKLEDAQAVARWDGAAASAAAIRALAPNSPSR